MFLLGPFACFKPPAPSDLERGHGSVIMLPGIEGNAWQLKGTYHGLRDAGIEQAIEIIPWGSPPLSSLPNLINIKENRRRADRIAAKIVELRERDGNAPLTLIGFSGGGGLAVLTLEALPESVCVDRTILVAAAISNRYDVEKIMPHCKIDLVNFYSKRDSIVGAGTAVFGTIDRVKTVSSGHSGFVDVSGGLLDHPKLKQVEWSKDWRSLGHHGGHLGYLSRQWAKEILAPLVVQDSQPSTIIDPVP